ncbi:hypothetical protein CARUB_v10016360mg [Capsella rubella]|uniref:Uncharacterized protein n=1 Tax=Capsella rubella TaxID=81985 RepID=R0I958_9BRAS|nr:uncharacterized protein LOC17892905 [Capsella rubella]XP_023641547.1 uncharacterized protein LOC17892905 [Capsella rubella]EOA33028.1 hypothetical protein CARUB_v10016360mg [Capsella rubella]
MICTESNHQRISFAGDLGQSNKGPLMEQPSGPVRRDTTLLDSSNSDFEFHTSRNFDPGDSSPADEIFADGMILPVLPFHVTTASATPKRLYKYELPPIVSAPSLSSSYLPPPPLPLPEYLRKYSVKETRGSVNGRVSGVNSGLEAEKSSKSFWSFKRSSSLNCDIKKSLICSFPRLTRSNSTGSVTNSKRGMLRDINKYSSQRHGVPRPGANSSTHMPPPSPPPLCCSSYHLRPQKQARKNGGGRGGSFWIAPVIGGPSPFGLGSILRLSKEKRNK